jgi:hypothetical protein
MKNNMFGIQAGYCLCKGKRRLAAEPKVKPKVSLIDVYKKTGTWEATYKVITCSPLVPDGTTVILFKIQGRG